MKCYFDLKMILIFVFSLVNINSSNLKIQGIYKQIVGKNDRLLSNKKQLKLNIKFKECSIKTGIINYVSQPLKSFQFSIHTTPCYVIMTPQEIRFHKNLDAKTLFHSVKMDSIFHINKSNPGTSCFDVMVNRADKNKLYQIPLKLCGNTKNEMKEWIDSINSFRYCRNSKNKNGKTLVEFNKVNEVKKSGSPLDHISYNSCETTSINTPSENHFIAHFKNEIKSISNTLNSAKIARTKMKRIMKGKLKKQRLINKKVLRKQLLIRKNLLNQAKRSSTKEEQIMNLSHHRKEIKILQNLKKKIKQIKKKELKEFKNAYKKEIKYEKKKVNKQGAKMIKMIMEQNKLTDFSNCTNPKLLKFTNKIYISSICKKYFGKWGLGDCSLRVNFCRMCCEHHVGVKHVNKLYQCKKNCTKLVNGTPIIKST